MVGKAKLKPCPFCGSKKIFITHGRHNFNDVMMECSGCDLQGPLFDEDDATVEKNRSDAIEHWNTRAYENGNNAG